MQKKAGSTAKGVRVAEFYNKLVIPPQTEWEIEALADRQTNRQTNRKADRQTDRQIGRAHV